MFPVNIIGAPVAAYRKVSFRVGDTEGAWFVPEEVPVAFVYHRRNYAVMLATPQDMIDYAAGFSLTERVVDHVDDIEGLEVSYSERGVDFRIRIRENLLERFDLRQRRRNMPGNTACGICGLENADELFADLPKVADQKTVLDPAAVASAFDALAARQPINQRTKSVHAAAWVSLSGDIAMLREDVGRHNALDKLLGALALADADMKAGFVLMSSRCSYELIEKAARRGVTALVSISGPTGLALHKAKQANMALYARGPKGAVVLLG